LKHQNVKTWPKIITVPVSTNFINPYSKFANLSRDQYQEVDPDPQKPKSRDPNPHKMNADPKQRL
jgi:hypothetical protein